MSNFFDITQCLFRPPTYDPQDSELVLKSNERIEYSAGDLEEYGGVSGKLDIYSHSIPKSMTTKEPSMLCPRYEGLSPPKGPSAFTAAQAAKHNSTPQYGKCGPAASIPFLVVDKPIQADAEFTIIYLHANSEDIMSSVRICRILGDYFRVVLLSTRPRSWLLSTEAIVS